MHSSALLFFAVLSVLVYEAIGCGCYGQGSCTLGGQLVRNSCSSPGSNVGVCDCCMPCNECPQLLAGCLEPRWVWGLHFSSPVPNSFVLNQPITPITISTTGAPATSFIDVCVGPALPTGLSITRQADQTFALTGTPTTAFPNTTFRILIKGSAGMLYAGTVSFGVSPCLQQ
ncbi:hypothetical protein RI367_003457 [Sorochytrium milnesiophthora]